MVYVRVVLALLAVIGLFVLVLFGIQNSLWEVTLRLDLGMAAWDVGPVRVLHLVLGSFVVGLFGGLGIWALVAGGQSRQRQVQSSLSEGGSSW